MSSVEHLRGFVNKRLTAAAEEIFSVFSKTIVEYEEVIHRQHKLLAILWKPEKKLHRTEVPQQHVCKEEEVLSDQQPCIQERNSSLDQEDPEPPQIKEEQEELCISQEGEPFELKQETETFMVNPIDEEKVPQQHVCKEEEVLSDQQLCIQERNSSLDQEDPEPPQIKEEQEELCISQEGEQFELKQETETFMLTPSDEESDHSKDQTLDLIKTDKSQSAAETELPASRFTEKSTLNSHIQIHSGEKPLTCRTCGKDFRYKSVLLIHMRRSHTGEKPYSCNTCGKNYYTAFELKAHIRIHTGEKPYSCKICGKNFGRNGTLLYHMKIHTGENAYSCNSCGKKFSRAYSLKAHMRIHTGEKPFSCKTCGRDFCHKCDLLVHIRIAHTGEKPYVCKICGKRSSNSSELARHIKSHRGK